MDRTKYLPSFLTYLFTTFQINNVDYVILRNYKSLPEQLNEGSDIDFLIDKKSWNKIYYILVSMQGVDILISSKRIFVHEFILRYEKEMFIKLDFHPFEDWRGAIYFTSESVLKSKIKYKNFYVASKMHQAFTMCLSSFLHGGFIKKKYNSIIKDIFQEQENFMGFENIFGKKNLDAIRLYYQDAIDDTNLLKYRKSIIYNIIAHNLSNAPVDYIRRFLKSIYDEIKYRISYNGIVIQLKTSNNITAQKKLCTWLHSFIGTDRIDILKKESSVKSKLLTYDRVGRLHIEIYESVFTPILMRKPDIILNDDNIDNLKYVITDFLIRRNKIRNNINYKY